MLGPIGTFVLLSPILYILFTIYFYFTNTSRFWTHISPIIIAIVGLISLGLFFEYSSKSVQEKGGLAMVLGMSIGAPIILLPPFYVFDDIRYVLFGTKSNAKNNTKQNNIRRNTVSNT